MDINDESLFREWEDDTAFIDFPDVSEHIYSDNRGSGPRNHVSSEEENCLGQVDNDYAVALSLQAEFDDELKENTNANTKKSEASKPLSIVDKQWELIDPLPDIHALFVEYDDRFFYGALKCVEVRWSKRMTLCAGICSYQGRGGLCSIGLSLPLLKLRPRRDLIETLLHEMIHAYLFVTQNNKDRDGHGPEFLSHMYRINKEAGTNITVYHSFHEEVNLYKKHWWKCDGPCRNRPPFYGLVKRAMNRAPGPNDNWWAAHQALCGGKFVKIKEPSNFSEKKSPKKKLHSDSKAKPPLSDIRKFISVDSPEPSNKESSNTRVLNIESSTLSTPKSVVLPEKHVSTAAKSTETSKNESFVPFIGAGHKLGTSLSTSEMPSSFSSINFKDLHLERERHWKSSSSQNVTNKDVLSSTSVDTLIKRAIPSSSLGKALNKSDLHSNSTEKNLTKRDVLSGASVGTLGKRSVPSSFLGNVLIKSDLPSNSTKKTLTKGGESSSFSGKGLFSTPHCKSAKIPRLSSACDTQNVQKGHASMSDSSSTSILQMLKQPEKGAKSASASLNDMKELDEIIVEKVLPPRNIPDNSDDLRKNSVKNMPSITTTKLYCPVCSNLIEEEINSHLDKCLKI